MLRGGGSIRNAFRFFRCDPRVAMCHFDSTAGDGVTGDEEMGVGGFGVRLPDLRLRGQTAVRLCLFEWLFTNLAAGLPGALTPSNRTPDGPGAEFEKTADEGVGGETIISA